MVANLLDSNPFLPLLVEAQLDELNGFRRAFLELRHIKAGLLLTGELRDLFFVLGVEGQVLRKHDVEHDAETPDVNAHTVGLTHNNLRRAVAERAKDVVAFVLRA